MTVCPLPTQPGPSHLATKSEPRGPLAASGLARSGLDSPGSNSPRLALPGWQAAGTLSIALAIALALFALQQRWQINLFSPDGFQIAVERVGVWGPLLYVLLLVISVVVSQIPGAGLAIAAGAVWGPFTAGLYTILGGFLGALIAYGLGRTVGPGLLKALTGKTITFSRDRGDRYLGGLILLMRLIPVFSFDLISYGAGMTRLSLPIYASATLLGMVPSTFLLTYLGGAFQLGTMATVGILGVIGMGLLVLPWGIRRHNWFDLQGVVQIR